MRLLSLWRRFWSVDLLRLLNLRVVNLVLLLRLIGHLWHLSLELIKICAQHIVHFGLSLRLKRRKMLLSFLFCVGINRILLFFHSTELLVNLTKHVVVVLIFVNLSFTAYCLFHMSIPSFRNSLCLCNIATTSELSRLLDRVSVKHVVISSLLKFLSLVANFLLTSDHSEILSSVKRSI